MKYDSSPYVESNTHTHAKILSTFSLSFSAKRDNNNNNNLSDISCLAPRLYFLVTSSPALFFTHTLSLSLCIILYISFFIFISLSLSFSLFISLCLQRSLSSFLSYTTHYLTLFSSFGFIPVTFFSFVWKKTKNLLIERECDKNVTYHRDIMSYQECCCFLSESTKKSFFATFLELLHCIECVIPIKHTSIKL